jgi:hypothetical protein
MPKALLLFFLFSLYFLSTASGTVDTLSSPATEDKLHYTQPGLSTRLFSQPPRHHALLAVTRRFASPLVVGIKSIVKYIIKNVGNV